MSHVSWKPSCKFWLCVLAIWLFVSELLGVAWGQWSTICQWAGRGVILEFFPKRLKIFNKNFNTKITQNCKILFNYPQLWQSYVVSEKFKITSGGGVKFLTHTVCITISLFLVAFSIWWITHICIYLLCTLCKNFFNIQITH